MYWFLEKLVNVSGFDLKMVSWWWMFCLNVLNSVGLESRFLGLIKKGFLVVNGLRICVQFCWFYRVCFWVRLERNGGIGIGKEPNSWSQEAPFWDYPYPSVIFEREIWEREREREERRGEERRQIREREEKVRDKIVF